MANVAPTIIEGRSLRLRLRLQPTTGLERAFNITTLLVTPVAVAVLIAVVVVIVVVVVVFVVHTLACSY